MRITSKRQDFDVDHSSYTYKFLSERRITRDIEDFLNNKGQRFEIRGKILSIKKMGDWELSDDVIEALMLKHNFTVMLSEGYEWWECWIVFDYNTELFEKLKEFETGEEHYINIRKKDDKILVRVAFHVEYDSLARSGFFSLFKYLGLTFRGVRENILENKFEPLKILHVYCNNPEKIAEMEPKSDVSKKLKSCLSVNW